MGPEAKLEKWCVNYARQNDAWLLKWVCPGHKGVPDRILIAPDTERVVFIEFKSPAGRFTKLQEIWRDRLHAHTIRTREEFVKLFENEIQPPPRPAPDDQVH